MSLFFLVGGCAAGVGYVLGRRARARADVATRPPVDADDPLRAFPFHLGDVLVRRSGDDVLLSSALVLFDGGAPRVAIFATAGRSDGAHLVVCFAAPDDALLWLEETLVDVPAEPPPTLLAKGATFERTRLVPVRTRRIGEAPAMDAEAKWAEYAAGSEVLVVAKGARDLLVGRGERLAIGDVDRMPGPSA